ncbi:MAG: FAD-binding protein [Catenulisporales bacterium]|nr:FAD-binding protein [Catenulisporales bacterium]
MAGANEWSNWAGNQTANAVRVATPQSASEVAEILRGAANEGLTVKAVGSGHSFTSAAATDGVLIRPDGLTRLKQIDREANLVTVESGMPLHQLNALLAENGMALTNMGDIQVQTVAGAIGTGTHGTGRASGSIAAQVAALEVVLAGGEIVNCSPEQNAELFQAARLGVGAIGYVTAVTFRTEPAFLLTAREEPMRMDAVLDGFEELVAENEHFEFYWFPYTDRTNIKRNNRATGPAAPLSGFRHWMDDEFLSNSVFGAVQRVARTAPRLTRTAQKVAGSALSARTYTDRSDKVFTSSRRVKFTEMEYAIPRAAFVETFRELTQLINASTWNVNFPIEVRVVPGDDLWLSTAHGRETAYIACHMYEGTRFEEYFKAAEQVFVAHDGRPHWGKLHTRDAEYLGKTYPRFEDFLGVRDRVDPKRLFANEYTKQVFGD